MIRPDNIQVAMMAQQRGHDITRLLTVFDNGGSLGGAAVCPTCGRTVGLRFDQTTERWVVEGSAVEEYCEERESDE